MTTRLARVRWAMGQTLLPRHLSAQEEALLADSAVRFGLHGLPAYGLAGLRWNETLLAEGVLSLEKATVVLPSGLLLDVGGNARLDPLNLNIAGATLVPVYLHVRHPPENPAERDGSGALAERDGIGCWLWPLQLSTEQDHPDTLESMRLAEFEKRPDGVWQLSARYIPPLLQVGTSPFLLGELSELAQRLDAYHYHLTQEIAAIYLSGESLVNAKLCLKSVGQLQRFLANLLAQIHPHPYLVHEALERFYVDLCFYRNTSPQSAAAPYCHEQLAECFRRVLDPLNEQLGLSPNRSPYLPLVRSDGIIRATLPPAIREAREIYLLVQKGRVTKTLHLEGVKIAAVSRIPLVHKFALQGIPLKRVERPPFQHSFGPEVEIHQLGTGEEWDHALRELALGFYADPELTEEKFFLYWRTV